MKFYSVHYGVSLDDRDKILGHFRKYDDAKKVFDYKVNYLRRNIGMKFEEESLKDRHIFWYVDEYDEERTDDWEVVWISEEQLQ